MKKGDYIIFAIVLIMAAGLFIYNSKTTGADYDQKVVQISIDNALYEAFILDAVTDREIDIDNAYGQNLVIIRDGKVWIADADCPDKICVLDGSIEEPGEILVCLPHKLVIEIKGTKNTEVDEVAY